MPNFYNYTYGQSYSWESTLKIDEKAGALTSDSIALKVGCKVPAQHERGTALLEVAMLGHCWSRAGEFICSLRNYRKRAKVDCRDRAAK